MTICQMSDSKGTLTHFMCLWTGLNTFRLIIEMYKVLFGMFLVLRLKKCRKRYKYKVTAKTMPVTPKRTLDSCSSCQN